MNVIISGRRIADGAIRRRDDVTITAVEAVETNP
jgi:hypothetical protein